MSEIHVALITFRRPVGLSRVAESILAQTRQPDRVYLFDNDPGDHGRHTAEILRRGGLDVMYFPSQENIGPAGAAASVMKRVAASRVDGDTWIMVVNDDIPFGSASAIADLERFASEVVSEAAPVGAVGRIGHRFDWSTARLVRPAHHEIAGQVDVDYLATGFMPMFRVDAIRDVGPMRADLFIGMTEVEMGLRLRRSGYRVVASGDLWRPTRGAASGRGPRLVVAYPSWRRYYSMRNLIVILRDYGHWITAMRVSVVRGVLKPMAGLLFKPRWAAGNLRLNFLAVRDAWIRRMGQTVRPPDEYEAEVGAVANERYAQR